MVSLGETEDAGNFGTAGTSGQPSERKAGTELRDSRNSGTAIDRNLTAVQVFGGDGG